MSVPDTIQRRFDAAASAARQGRLDAAIAAYRSLLETCPELPGAWANLGFALQATRQWPEAARCFRHVVAVRPRAVPAWLGLAKALHRQGDVVGARHAYGQVLTLQPAHVRAMLGLGDCWRRAGRMDAACTWFARATIADPACVDAYYLLSITCAAAVDAERIARCEALRDRVATMSVPRRERYWFALGGLLEGVGRNAAAFAAYAAGNQLHAAQFTLDESAEDVRFARIRELFPAPRWRGDAVAHGARVPVFIVGMPRSGTTLVEQILASHPGVWATGESSDLQDVLAERLGSADDWAGALSHLAPEAGRGLGEAYLERAWRGAPMATHVVNKMVANYRYLGLICSIFPNPRIIHVVRDPVDVCWSCFTRLFAGDSLAYTYDLRALGRYYVRYARCMQHWRHALPAGVLLEVHYDALVAEPEFQVRRLLAHLGLEWNAACLAFHRNPRVAATASRAQVTRPLYRTSVGRGHRFEAYLRPLLDVLAEAPNDTPRAVI